MFGGTSVVSRFEIMGFFLARNGEWTTYGSWEDVPEVQPAGYSRETR